MRQIAAALLLMFVPIAAFADDSLPPNLYLEVGTKWRAVNKKDGDSGYSNFQVSYTLSPNQKYVCSITENQLTESGADDARYYSMSSIQNDSTINSDTKFTNGELIKSRVTCDRSQSHLYVAEELFLSNADPHFRINSSCRFDIGFKSFLEVTSFEGSCTNIKEDGQEVIEYKPLVSESGSTWVPLKGDLMLTAIKSGK